jgi:undecaprenyl-diphosphatase
MVAHERRRRFVRTWIAREWDHLPAPWREGTRRFLTEWSAAVGLGVIALLGVSKVGEDVFNHESGSFDAAIRRWMIGHQTPVLTTAFRWITAVGEVPVVGTVSLLVAIYLYVKRGRRVAAVCLGAPTIATAIFLGAKQLYARPRPNFHGHALLGTYSFPSGHATASAAICCTIAYVLWREHLVAGRTAAAVAIIPPLLIGFSRVYLTYHWATDVLGGWSVGVLIAVIGGVLYDRGRRAQR